MATEDSGMNKALTPLTEGLAKLCSKLFSEAADETGKFFAESLRQRFSRSKIKNAAEILEQRIEPCSTKEPTRSQSRINYCMSS